MARRSSFLLLLMAAVLSIWCGGAFAARPAPSSSSSAALFVRSWCAGTEYPALCDSTLASYAAEVGSSAARLSWAALTVTHSGARDAAAAMKRMAAAGNDLAPAAASDAQDCVGMLGDAVEMLRQLVEAMARLGDDDEQKKQSSGDVRFHVNSVQTWASAALTDADMCMEGFRAEAPGGGGAREAVRGHVAGVAHLTANALSIVNAMDKQMP